MKKIIIAVAIACAAAMLQAAQVQWQATATSAYNGQNLYLLTEIASDYVSLENFEASAVGLGKVTKSGPTYKVAQVVSKDDSITKTSNFYLAVVDGDTIHYLDVTSSFQPMVFAPPESAPGNATAVFANVANSTTTVKIGGGPGPEPIPEPTSGLLILLGMASLALKRKRA